MIQTRGVAQTGVPPGWHALESIGASPFQTHARSSTYSKPASSGSRMRNILALPPEPSERDNHIFSKRVVHIQPNGEVFRVQTGSSHWQTSGYESVGIVKNLPFGF